MQNQLVITHLLMPEILILCLETIQQVIDKDNHNYYAWSILGQAYEMSNALSLAEEAFRKFGFFHNSSFLCFFCRACCLCPTESKLWVSRGVCYKKMKELEYALWCLQKAQKLGNKGLTVENYIKVIIKSCNFLIHLNLFRRWKLK